MALPVVPAAVRRRLARGTLTIRRRLLRHAPVRALVGLAVGFGAAAATVFVVDRYGVGDDDADTVVIFEELDHDGYCADRLDGGRALRVSDDQEGWRCGGFVDGLWSPVVLDLEALCRWQFGEGAELRLRTDGDPFGWICIDNS